MEVEMKNKNTTTIIGYTLDAVIYARELAEAGNKVVFINTGTLGYPLDNIRDYITYNTVQKIKSFDPIIQFTKIVSNTYVFFPYGQLEFVNSHNGLISFPLNKKSFESAEEWEQIESCISQMDKFKQKLENATNYINIYKKFFPKWLYDSMIKYIGVNKWGGLKQAKFTKETLTKEINLTHLNEYGNGNIYKPDISYKSVCEKLLNNKNIKITEIPVEKLRNFVVSRQKDTDVVFMDNRIDYLCNYSYGRFERISISSEFSKESNLEEFIDINDGIVLTPMKDYWCITNEFGNICKIKTQYKTDFKISEMTQHVPTAINKKIYNEYKKLLHLYSGKQLSLEPLIESVIL